MKNIFAWLFPQQTVGLIGFTGGGKRTVDGALVHFTKALTELRAVKAEQDAEEARQLEAATAATYAAGAALREAQRAAKAIAKIEDFIV